VREREAMVSAGLHLTATAALTGQAFFVDIDG
jgi:hypothetical protein